MRRTMDVKSWLETVVSAETAADIIAHRKAIKVPMTERAAKIAASQLSLIPEHFREQAVDIWVNRGWRGFEADWALKQLNRGTERRGIVGAAIRSEHGQEHKGASGNYAQWLPAISKH